FGTARSPDPLGEHSALHGRFASLQGGGRPGHAGRLVGFPPAPHSSVAATANLAKTAREQFLRVAHRSSLRAAAKARADPERTSRTSPAPEDFPCGPSRT